MAPQTSSSPPVRIEERAGYGVGAGALGLLVLTVLLVVSEHPLEDLAFGLVFSVVFGVLMWLTSRTQARRRPLSDRLVGSDARRPFVRGLAQAAVVGVLIGLFVVLFVWIFGPDQGWGSLPAVLLGTALWTGLEVNDHRRRLRAGRPEDARADHPEGAEGWPEGDPST